MVERIVIVRPGHIGDVLAGVPALRAVRAAFPRAEVSLVGLPHTRRLVERFDRYVDRFLEFPGYPGICDRPIDTAATMRFIEGARADRYDVALQLKGSGVFSNPFTKLLGARFTAGFVRGGDSPVFFGLDAYHVWDEHRHEALRPLDLLATMGVPGRGTALEFPLGAEDEAELGRVLDDDGAAGEARWVVVHPGARFGNRRWPVERFADAAGPLACGLEARIAVSGSRGETELTRALTWRLGPRAVDLGGRLSLGGLGALLRRAALCVTNDTGPAHLAYALGTPSVTVFGNGAPARWGPLDRARHRVVEAPEACHPCVGDGCIARVPAEAVKTEAEDLLRAVRAATAPNPSYVLSASPPSRCGSRGSTRTRPRTPS